MPEDTKELALIFALPSLGSDMDYGSVLEWRVAVGSEVKRGDVVAVVATEKADIDVEIWQDGTVAELLLEVGKEVPVGTPLLRLSGGADDTTPVAAPIAASATESAPAPALGVTPIAVPVVMPASTVGASPRARILAKERGVDLSAVRGSGPGGAVLERDLVAAVPLPPAVSGRSKSGRADRMRHAIADRMAKANAEIPHYHLDLDIDLGPALTFLERHNGTLPVNERVLPAAMLIKATALAAASEPTCNGFWTPEGFEKADAVDVGIAISLRGGGLVTPVIADADELSLDALMAAMRDRVAAARANTLRSSWMTDASLTVTNLGDNGAQRVHGVIFPPQVALVGFGKVQQRPWADGESIVARPVISATFSGDHRATDGATGSRFLAALARSLTEPEKL